MQRVEPALSDGCAGYLPSWDRAGKAVERKRANRLIFENFVWEETKVEAPERVQVRLRSTAVGVPHSDATAAPDPRGATRSNGAALAEF
jgi:hypothetical protein